jgi:uncharacterized ion transporter superfamily protein YfcC
MQGVKDLAPTALVIAIARATMVIARDAHIIDTMMHALMPLVQSSHPVFAAQKMYLIQSAINFFIHSGSGQAALTMPIMAPLADLVGVLALARVPWWAKWMRPLQLIYLVLALALLVPPCLMQWS